MKLQIEKLEDVDVFFSTEAVSEEQHLRFSEFLQKRKRLRETRSANANKASDTTSKIIRR